MHIKTYIRKGGKDLLFQLLMKIGFILCFIILTPMVLLWFQGQIVTSVFLLKAFFPIAAFVLTWLCLKLSQNNQTKLAINLYLSLLFISLFFSVIIFDGIYSPALGLFIWPILISGLLIKPKWSLYSSLSFLVFYVFLTILTTLEWYSPFFVENIGSQILLSKFYLVFVMFISVGVVFYITLEQSENYLKKLKISEKKLLKLVNKDKLTKINNREGFFSIFEKTLSRVRRSDQKLALLFIDLDRFKNVNDTFGHLVGDQILKQVSKDVTHLTRSMDIVCRFGGDEFICVFESSKNIRHLAEDKAKKIIDKLKKLYKVDGKDIQIGASIGISIYPDDSKASDELINKADAAMYQAKKKGRNQYVFYKNQGPQADLILSI